MAVKKIRVCICSPGVKPIPALEGGAVEQLVTAILNKNEEEGNFEFVVYTIDSKKLESISYINTDIIKIKNRQKFIPIRIKYSFINRIYFLRKIKKHIDYMSENLPEKVVDPDKYDLIIVENNAEIFFKIQKRIKNTKIVFHLHNDFDTIKSDFDKTSDRMKSIGNIADEIWVASKYLKKRIESLRCKASVQLLENCVNRDIFNKENVTYKEINDFKDKYNIQDRHFMILFCGRIDREKGVLELLKAVKLLPSNVKIKVVIVGSQWFGSRTEKKYMSELNQLSKELEDMVIFTGYIDQENMPYVYLAADLVIIPTQCTEAFGMVALEAITMGKVCIVSQNGGLNDLINSECGIKIVQDYQYVESLSKAIYKLYSNRELLKQMEKKAIEQSLRFMDEDAYFERFRELVDHLVELKEY